MFKSFKKFFAKTTLAVLLLQLFAFAAPVSAATTPTLSTDLDLAAKQVVAGVKSDFYVSLANTGTEGYSDAAYDLVLYGDQTAKIASFEYQKSDLSWELVTPVYDFPYTVLDENPSFDLASGFNSTKNYRIALNTPDTYEFGVYVSATNTGGTTSTIAGFDFQKTVSENNILSANIKSRVKTGVTETAAIDVDGTYGLDHASATSTVAVTLKDTVATDLGVFKLNGVDPTYTVSGSDLVATYVLPSDLAAGGSASFTLDYSLLTEKTYNYAIAILDGTDVVASYESAVIVDGTAPKVTVTSVPKIVNNIDKVLVVTFTGDEDMVLSSSEIEFTQGLVSYNVAAADASITKPQSNQIVVTVPGSTFTAGTTSINVRATFADLVGNEGDEVSEFVSVDTVAPAAVTNLVAAVNEQGYVILSWTNPVNQDSYSGIEVLRDGAHLVSLEKTATTYTDTTVTAGQTYSYAVTTYDEAGNMGTINPVQVTVPSKQLAAAVSDSSSDSGNTGTVTETKKAESTSSEDETKYFPWWGIVILVILAAIGGWLVYSQKPLPAPVPVAVAKKPAPKKTPTKKKSTTNKKTKK